MRLTARVEGAERTAKAMADYSASVQSQLADALSRTGLDIRNGVIARIQGGPKSGQVYQRRSVTHQASAAGEAPATDTGALVSSYKFQREIGLAVTVGSDLVYSAALEFGIGMDARPHLTPEVEAQVPKLRQRIAEILG